MHLYRLAKQRHIRDLSGTGARMYGGRWNQKGTPALYTSEHRSLAILEFLVHTSLHALPPNISLLELSVDEDIGIKKISMDLLPESWRTYPAPDRLAQLGTDWLLAGDSLLLKVPSVIVPEEWNIIINPEHPDFNELDIKTVSSFDLDSRFLNSP